MPGVYNFDGLSMYLQWTLNKIRVHGLSENRRPVLIKNSFFFVNWQIIFVSKISDLEWINICGKPCHSEFMAYAQTKEYVIIRMEA